MQRHYSKRIIIDTNAIIRYFGIETRKDTNESQLSRKGRDLISQGLEGNWPLFLSSISIIEIWANIMETEKAKESLILSVRQLYEEDNLRVVQLSFETLEKFSNIPNTPEIKEHDKIIFANAIEYDCNIIITTDNSIIEFCKKNKDLNIEVIS